MYARTGRYSERQEIAIEPFGSGTIRVVADQVVAHDLSRACDLPAAMAPAIVGEGQVEKLQAAVQSASKSFLIIEGLRSYRPAHLAANVGQLFEQCQLLPTSRSEAHVETGGHSSTNRFTIAMIVEDPAVRQRTQPGVP